MQYKHQYDPWYTPEDGCKKVVQSITIWEEK